MAQKVGNFAAFVVFYFCNYLSLFSVINLVPSKWSRERGTCKYLEEARADVQACGRSNLEFCGTFKVFPSAVFTIHHFLLLL